VIVVFMLGIGLSNILPARAEVPAELLQVGAQLDISGNDLPGVIAGGAHVNLRGNSKGRVFIIGARVDASGDDQDGVYLVGADVTHFGTTAGDVALYGGNLVERSSIDGGLTAVGSSIEVAKGSTVREATSLTGAKVRLDGDCQGAVTITADDVEIGGQVKGPLDIQATRVHFTDGAQIDGDVTLAAITDPTIDPAAKILGKLNRQTLSDVDKFALSEGGTLRRIVSALFLTGSALLAGLLLLWLARGGAEGSIDEMIDSPWASALWGALGLILLPIAAIIMALTVIGAPVAVLALLALPLVLLLSYSAAGLGLGEWMFNRIGEPRPAGIRALHLLIGLIGLGLIGLIPYVGPLLLVFATLCGFGALLRSFHDRLRGAQV
jgi:cytoskeletal protein CcmA (bactofilin family)